MRWRAGHHHTGGGLCFPGDRRHHWPGRRAWFVTWPCALKNKLGWDDALDVWGVHGVGGFLGIVMLGVFASTALNPAGADGLLVGNGAFLVNEIVAVALSSVWALAFTYGMLWLIDRVTPVKVDRAAEEGGLDAALHGETAYLGT